MTGLGGWIDVCARTPGGGQILTTCYSGTGGPVTRIFSRVSGIIFLDRSSNASRNSGGRGWV